MKKQFSFYKKKPFYIVLIVIFSLLLALDVAIGLFVPTGNMGFGGNGDFSQMPGGMDFGDMDFGDMEMPEGMEMPDGMEFGEDGRPSFGGGSFPGGSYPGGSSQSGGAQNNTRPGSMGFLQTIKSNWVWIAVVLAALDGASIFMLLRIRKNEKNNNTPGGSGRNTTPALIEEPKEHPQWVKQMIAKWESLTEKYRFLKHIDKVAIAFLLVVVIVIGSMGDSAQNASQSVASVYSGTVEKGEITKVVSGTGTITDDTAESVDLPKSIEITKWYVSNGDVVVEGQKLAQVDKISVMSAIAEIQEKLTELDEELESKDEESIDETIKANTDGKVKYIYAQKDKDVVDIMYEHGALMLLSLDGMMALSFETEEELYAGDMVSVVTEEGKTLSGKVQSVAKGTVVITVSDESVDYAEKVTVSTEEGVVLGTGEVYIHSELKVTGYVGTVDSVNVSLNEEVEKGDTLLELENTEYKAEYETLLLERRELECMMQELIQIYQEGYLYANIAGIVKGMDDSVASTAETTETAGVSVATSGFTGGNGQTDVSNQQSNQNQQDIANQQDVTGQQGSSSQQGTMNQQGSTGIDLESMLQGSGTGMGEITGNLESQTGQDKESDYTVATTSVVSIVPQNKLTIDVTVDEMDILSVEVGQETEITLDAFPGQAFSGSVSSVDYNGTNSGGSTKYTVIITMERGENMLDGMNASVSIVVDKTEDILLVPIEALVEDESGVYVYTKYNEKTEIFSNKAEVTTGASDGMYVEILSGLEAGSEYWYSSLEVKEWERK